MRASGCPAAHSGVASVAARTQLRAAVVQAGRRRPHRGRRALTADARSASCQAGSKSPFSHRQPPCEAALTATADPATPAAPHRRPRKASRQPPTRKPPTQPAGEPHLSGLLEEISWHGLREAVLVDQGLMTEIGGGDCSPLDYNPAVLALRLAIAHCVSRVDRQLEEVDLNAAVVTQDVPDSASHVAGSFAALRRALDSAPPVAPKSLARRVPNTCRISLLWPR